ncbi:coproporphyrinogen III oxidase [Pradoshia sp. D12]|uniref:coproporphyrinogen III oxidase n=1 Tax=Bacillaceae TaxID=186817 RepID=UPI00080AE28C|nr:MULTISPECIES: coproporphyrinogen III oxidase [Bacillaceae]OCA90122.1 coproporphyrinogen III oxidase [Bacillus sp. FJAT-27986]QFK70472.1 coproporphyrinogen III oxidase [Pradoshia sp. D12]TPF72267.1 coproporphyrinogen III oxidase [Bacillus sp. D12]
MRILINGIEDERLYRPLSLIADLFFEEATLLNSDESPSDLSITLKQEMINHTLYTKAILEDSTSNKVHESTFERDVLNQTDEKALFKQKKHSYSYVFLKVLEQHTGMIQKWGLLTGVRPTKLWHQYVKKNIDASVAKRELSASYSITDEKLNLLEEIADRQLEVIPDLYDLKREVSIYIGIPFCPTKCAYCTFPAYAINGRQGNVTSFLGGLHYEMREIGKWLKDNHIKITTIYFGGGTPTSISAEEMDILYEELYESFPDIKNVREITVEAGRPDTITPEKLKVLKKWNIDRISINPQSYTQETLKAIGRHHTVEETIEKYKLAKEAGMNNVNMDLIIGLPGEGVPELKNSLHETEKLMPESLTVHTLSFKRASEMTRNKMRYKVADRTEVEQMMNEAEKWTAAHGYHPYYLYRQKNILGNLENVGYSLPGMESLYNILIMEEQQTIIGLGCGAASKFIDPDTGKITHFANPKDPKSYNDSYEHYTTKKIDYLKELFLR